MTSIRSDHKNKTRSGIIPQWVCHLLPQENHPNSCQHAQNVKRSWECFIYPSTCVFFISLLKRDCLSFSLTISASWTCCLVVGSGKHQPVTVGLSAVHLEFAQTAAQEGGGGNDWCGPWPWSEGQQPRKDLHSPKFLNLLQLAMSFHKLYLCRSCVAGKKGKCAVPRYGQWTWGRTWWNLPDSRGSVGCKSELCNAYNPAYFSLFYFKTLNPLVITSGEQCVVEFQLNAKN